MKFHTSARTAFEALGVRIPPEAAEVEARFPVYVNDYYLKLIDPANWRNDPIARQALPDRAELEDDSSSFDPLAEEIQMPVARLIHRFADRVVLLATGRCAMRCRFCFRKRTWTTGMELDDISDAELEEACAYLRRTPAVREVLISGGDPLMLPFEHFRRIVDAVAAVESIEIIRIATRLPAVWPQRIDAELCDYLRRIPGLWVATHFNHPRELSAEARRACALLVSSGVPVINQTVLLKGVNDDAETLEQLFRSLVALRVKPHYLFHVDPVRGVRHFATGIGKGLEILRAFRPRLSSLAVPTFAIDLPEGGGKVALQPDYSAGAETYWDIHGKKAIPYRMMRCKESR
ncbi:KamA family radical SAM protein [uncultured Victivallis sp.]|uniref:KamA family radical SAM protein n=1 Tax=uncultured Victivallis sp. TaxID=354118 RepID=UPI0025CDCBCC|nr:KamA family radical SAM protein [uncultured Victivallis sp.]